MPFLNIVRSSATWLFAVFACTALPALADSPRLQRVYIGGTINGSGASCDIILGTDGASAGTDNVIRGTTSLYPDKVYQLTFNAQNVSQATITLAPPGGYRVFVNGTERKMIQVSSPTSEVYDVEIRAGGSGGTPGSPSPVVIGGDVSWGVALGRLYNGTLAGSLVIRSATLSGSIFDRSILSYSGTGNQVFVYNDATGKLRQITAPEVFVDVQDITGGFRIDFYPLSAMGSPQPGGLRPITNAAAKYVSYEIKRGTGGIGLDVVRTAGSVSTTTEVDQTGGSWTKSLEGDIVVEERTEATNADGDRVETIILKDAAGVVARKTTRTFHAFPWNQQPNYPQADELIKIVEDPDGKAYTTDYTYYTDSGNMGSYARIKSIVYPEGNWVKYEYFEDDERRGRRKFEYHPWLDLPASPDSASSGSGRVIEYDYTADWDGMKSIVSSRVEKINGTIVGKYTATATVNQSANGLKLYTLEKTTYSDAATTLVSTVKTYQPNQDEANSVYNDLPYSITNPDSTKVSFVHQRGTFDESTGTFTLSDTGTAMREIVLQGTAKTTVGTNYATMEGAVIDSINLIANRSTKKISIRKNGRLLREEIYIFTGTVLEAAGWSKYTYTASGRLEKKESSNGSVYEATWENEFKVGEVTETGTEYFYSPDLAQRVKTVIKGDAPATSDYPAQNFITTVYTYDAAGQILENKVTGGGITLTESTAFDKGGRTLSQTRSDGTVTTYVHNPSTRQTTTTLPSDGTQIRTHILTKYLDGRPKSVTGTAQTAQYFTHTCSATNGFLTAKQYQVSTTSGAWSENTTDWLGRTTASSAPGANANEVISLANSYNSIGQLAKTTRTGSKPMLFVYDDLGVAYRSGLDVNGDDALTNASMDRISEQEGTFVKLDGQWWWHQRSYGYPKDNDATRILLGESRSRVTGFTGGLVAEQQASDLKGNLTIQTTYVDRGSKLVRQLVNAPGSTTDARQVSYNGLLVESRSLQNETVTYGYDAVGRSATVTHPRKGTLVTQYVAGKNLVAQTSYLNGPVIAKYQYDTAARVIRIEDGEGQFVRKSYDNCGCGRLSKTWGSATYPVQYTYDTLGRLWKQSTYRGGTGWANDTTTTPTAFDGPADTTTFSYYGDTSFLYQRQDAAGKNVRFTYDSAGRLYEQTHARLYNSLPLKVTLGYDANTGELTSRTFSDDTPDVAFTYTRAGQVKTVADATGTRTFNYDTTTGLMLENEALPADFFGTGRRVSYAYDAATDAVVKGRLTGYDFGTSSDPDADQSTDFDYTADGRLDGIGATPAGQTARDFTYGYNANQPSLVTGLTESTTGYTLNRTYHSRWDMVASISTRFGTAVKSAHAYTFDDRGQRLTALQSGEAFADYGPSTYYRYDYNDKGELRTAAAFMGTDVTSETSPLPGRRFEFGYDSIGNRTSANHTGSATLNEDYTANSLNQVTSKENHTVHFSGTGVTGMKMKAQSPFTSTSGYQGKFWSTEVGLQNVSTPAKASIPLAFGKAGAGADGKDLIATDSRAIFLPAALETFTYDLDGNLTQDGRWDYLYDAENRLVRMETRSSIFSTLTGITDGEQPRALAFQYDYLGRRVSKKVYSRSGNDWVLVSERRYVYQGWNVIAELNASGTTQRQFFWGLDVTGTMGGAGGVGGLLMIQDGANTYLPSYDGNGNVTALMRADGTIAAAYEYSPYGELLRCEGAYAAANPFRWSTKWTDDETGLVYYGLRYYDTRLGRFINRDPIGEKGGLNLYAFVGNDPVGRIDMLGLYWEWVVDGYETKCTWENQGDAGWWLVCRPTDKEVGHYEWVEDGSRGGDGGVDGGSGSGPTGPTGRSSDPNGPEGPNKPDPEKDKKCAELKKQLHAMNSILANANREPSLSNPMSTDELSGAIIDRAKKNISGVIDAAVAIYLGPSLLIQSIGMAAATDSAANSLGGSSSLVSTAVTSLGYAASAADYANEVNVAMGGRALLSKVGSAVARDAGYIGAVITVADVALVPYFEYEERNTIQQFRSLTAKQMIEIHSMVAPVIKMYVDEYNKLGCGD